MKRSRKDTGKKYKKARKKKSHEKSPQKRNVKLGEDNRKTKNVIGGNKKTVLFNSNKVNLKKDKKIQTVKIKNVLETPANRFLARQNILTKGTIIETDLGKAKITNRPSQEGQVNGILIE